VTNELKSVFRIPLVDGLLVEVVEPGSPADTSGINGGILDVTIAGQELLLGGDIITKINGATVATPDEFEKVLTSLHVGSDVVIDVFREGKTMQFRSKLPERPVLPQDVRGGVAAKQKDLKTTKTHRRGF
jgi:S1-C subfamily serine protease